MSSAQKAARHFIHRNRVCAQEIRFPTAWKGKRPLQQTSTKIYSETKILPENLFKMSKKKCPTLTDSTEITQLDFCFCLDFTLCFVTVSTFVPVFGLAIAGPPVSSSPWAYNTVPRGANACGVTIEVKETTKVTEINSNVSVCCNPIMCWEGVVGRLWDFLYCCRCCILNVEWSDGLWIFFFAQ